MLACFRTLQIFAPLVGDDLGLDANFGPVSLDHLSHTARVRVVRTLYRHCPQIDGEAFFHPGFFQQRFRFFRIVSVVFNVVVIAPHSRWNQVFRGLTCALVNGFDNRFFIYRIGQRLADLHVIQRFLLGVEGEIADVQARLFQQVNVLIFFHARDVGRVRVRHHLALILLQFGIAHGSIRRNGEDQAIDLRLGAPVAREGFIENTGVFLILQQLERTGTDWVQVHFFRRTGFQHVVGILFRQNRGEVHRQVSEERRFRASQHKLDGFIVDFLHFANQVRQAHPFEVFIAAAGHFMVRVLRVFLAIEREYNVVGIQVASRFKVFIILPLHALTQVERIGFAVLAHFPFFRQPRNHFRSTGFEFNQAVIDGHRAGVIGCTRSE